jgi:hypothetical protein
MAVLEFKALVSSVPQRVARCLKFYRSEELDCSSWRNEKKRKKENHDEMKSSVRAGEVDGKLYKRISSAVYLCR